MPFVPLPLLEQRHQLTGDASDETAVNPEIQAVTQHQDPASDGAAATNKATTLALAQQREYPLSTALTCAPSLSTLSPLSAFGFRADVSLLSRLDRRRPSAGPVGRYFRPRQSR